MAIWHPVSAHNEKQSTKLYEVIKSAVNPGKEILAMEMYPSENNNNDRYMVGTGMVMANPPYGIDKELQDTLPRLDRYLSPSTTTAKSSISIKFL